MTESAQRYRNETDAALDLWEKARQACLRQAEQASTLREAAQWTAWSYRIAGRALTVQGNKSAECETYKTGIAAVEAIESRSPHVAMLYDRLGLCVAEFDGAAGVEKLETALDLVVEAYGARDARAVDIMIHLAVVLPYSVAPHGDLSTVSGPEVQVVTQRIAELRRAAWEIVQEDPNASIDVIRRASASFQTWQAAYGEETASTREIEAELIARRASGDP